MVQEKFYALTFSEFHKINSLLKDAELRVYLCLMTLNPFGDRKLEIDTAYLAENLGLTRRTIQRAVKRLQELNLIEIEISKFRYVKKNCQSDTRIAEATDGSPKRQMDRQSDTRIAKATDGSPKRQMDRQRPPEPSPSKDSKGPQTIQTYTDFKKTFSDSQREEFFNSINERQRQYLEKHWDSFIDRCLSDCERMPNPPTLPESFIRKHFVEMSKKFIRSAPSDVTQTTKKERYVHPHIARLEKLARERMKR